MAGRPSTFQAGGVDLKRDGVVLGLGLSGQARRNLSVFGDVNAELRNGQSNVTLFVGARQTW